MVSITFNHYFAAPGYSCPTTRNSDRYFLFVLACFLFGASTPAQSYDLLEAYNQARTHDARLGSARAAYRAGEEKQPQALSELLPSLGVTGSRTYYDASIEYRGDTTFQGGQRNYDNNEYRVNLTQPLYRKQNFVRYAQSKAQVRLAQLQFAAAEQDLIVRVTQAYLDVLSAQENLTFLTAQKTALTEQLQQARALLAAGTAAITDVHEAKAHLDLTRAEEIAAENDVATKKQALWKITGARPTVFAVLSVDMPLPALDGADLEKWLSAAEARSPTLAAQRENVAIAGHEVRRVRGGHFPTIDFVAGYESSRSSGSVFTSASSDTTSKSAGVQLQLPLYQGGGVNSQVREAAANVAKASEDLEEARREAALKIHQAFVSIAHGLSQIAAFEQALLSSDSALDSSRAGLRVGTRSRIDLLNAEQRVYSVKRDLARARYDYLFKLITLKAAAGVLTEADVAEVNKLLR